MIACSHLNASLPFNGEKTKTALIENDNVLLSQLESRKKTFIERTNQIIENEVATFGMNHLGIEADMHGSYILRYSYPILVSRQ